LEKKKRDTEAELDTIMAQKKAVLNPRSGKIE